MCVWTHLLGLNMLDSWKQWVASGWEGRFIGVGGRERVGFMAAATQRAKSDRILNNKSDG